MDKEVFFLDVDKYIRFGEESYFEVECYCVSVWDFLLLLIFLIWRRYINCVFMNLSLYWDRLDSPFIGITEKDVLGVL